MTVGPVTMGEATKEEEVDCLVPGPGDKGFPALLKNLFPVQRRTDQIP